MNAVEKIEPTALVPANLDPMEIAQLAIKSGDLDLVREGFKLYKEMKAEQSLIAFNNAISDAKAEIPVIIKNREVDFTTQKGRTNYQYEDLAGIAKVIDPILGRHGLSYRFRTTSAPNEPVTVTCIVSHRDGHFEENTLMAGRDDTGNKNSLQSIMSSVTYLSRYTLKSALGLAAGRDDDGKQADAKVDDTPPPPGSITQEQVDNIRDLLEAKGAAVSAFLNHAKLKRIEDMPAERYDAMVKSINGFRKS